MNFLKKIKHIDWVIAAVTTFILIKLISNYSIILSGIGKVMSIISPFICAVVIAYVLNPLMSFMERRFKLKRTASLTATYILIILLLVVVNIFLLPKVFSSIVDFIKNLPQLTLMVQNEMNNFISSRNLGDALNSAGIFGSNMDFSKISELMKSVFNASIGTVIAFTNNMVRWVFGFIISIYILYDKEKFIAVSKRAIYLIFKKRNGDRLLEFLTNMNNMISVYIGIKAIDSLIIGAMSFVGLSILRSPYALLIAVIVGVTNMIPYFGPFIGMLVAFLINLFFVPMKGVYVVIFLFLLQQFDSWYLDPKLIGGKVGLSPFLIILAVTIGGGLYGAIGMLMAVPTMAVIKIYADRLAAKYDI